MRGRGERRAIAADPNYILAHKCLADALRSTGDTAGASAEYQIYRQLAANASDE